MTINIRLTDEELRDEIIKVVAKKAGIDLDKFNGESESYNRGNITFTEKEKTKEKDNE